MNRKQLIDAILAHADRAIPRSHVELMLDGLALTVQKAVMGDTPVMLPGIGKIAAVGRNPRVGRNPKTGERLVIQARRYPRFTPIKMLKDVCNGNAVPDARGHAKREQP